MHPVNAEDVRPWGSLSWPNRISILRLLLVAPFIVLLLNQNRPEWFWARHAAVGVFIVMAVSDVIDGVLARRLDAKTRLGAILDPLADKALIISAVILLSQQDPQGRGVPLSNWVMVAVVSKDLWVIIGFIVIYLVTDRLRVEPTLSGKICTFGQLVMVGLFLIAPGLSYVIGKLAAYLATGLSWVVAGLCVLAGISYTRLGLSFIAREQKPLEASAPGQTGPNGSD